MTEEVKTEIYRSATDDSMTISAKFGPLTNIINAHSMQVLVQRIACAIADRYVAEHYAEIMAKLDQNAIANLAIAEAGKKIAEEIQRVPNTIHEKRVEIYQRGIFGGLRRVS
jgi:predicted transcriptional regulator